MRAPQDQILPGTYNVRFGNITSRRGLLEEAKLFSWDVVPTCPIPPDPTLEPPYPGITCPALPLCDFAKSSSERIIKCGVTTQYLRGTAEVIFNNFASLLSEDDFYRLGMHLMPLYRMLIKLKIHELGVRRAVTTSDRGVTKANPIYKEIRETIKSIEAMWVSLQLSGPHKRKAIGKLLPPTSGDVSMIPAQDFSEPGSYYEAMAAGKLKTEEQMKERHRKETLLNLRK